MFWALLPWQPAHGEHALHAGLKLCRLKLIISHQTGVVEGLGAGSPLLFIAMFLGLPPPPFPMNNCVKSLGMWLYFAITTTRLCSRRGLGMKQLKLYSTIGAFTSLRCYHSSTILLDDQLVHLGYRQYGKELLLIALPARL